MDAVFIPLFFFFVITAIVCRYLQVRLIKTSGISEKDLRRIMAAKANARSTRIKEEFQRELTQLNEQERSVVPKVPKP